MKAILALLLGAALGMPGLGQPAAAVTTRPTLPASAGSAHFLVHYDPATASADYVNSALADFEEARSRLVTGGGGTPNAGLRAPVNDAPRGGDGRTDVYLTKPADAPADWTGGRVDRDGVTYADPLVDSGFIYMTPSQPRLPFRFRSAHEYMHVVQLAYLTSGGLFNESTANWAADFALPDIEPGDSQFDVPFLPLDCSYGKWEGQACGNGYRQWLFIQWLSERFGGGFVHRLWALHASQFPYNGTTPAIDRQILTKAIADEPGDATLASTYADYAAALWDPTLWSTTAVDSLHSDHGTPAATDVGVSRAAPQTGQQTVTVDHFATRFIRFSQSAASAAGDQLRVRVTPAPGAAAPRLLSATGPGRARSVTMMPVGGGGVYEAVVSLDAAQVGDVVLPLTNNTATDDGVFAYSAELLPAGPATPPVNDGRASPTRIQPGTTTVLDIAYAGGSGAEEAPDCPSARSSRGGVWFVMVVDKGPLRIDPRGSDFDPAVAVYDITAPTRPYLWGCSATGSRGLVTGDTYAREYLIYVGRSTAGGSGHTLRLGIEGVPNTFGQTPEQPLPVVSALTISPKRFKATRKGPAVTGALGGRGGGTLSFTASVAATGRFSIQRREPGRSVRGNCVKATKANKGKKKCVRFVRVADVRVPGLPAGDVRLKLTGRRNSRKALPPGGYRLRVVVVDEYGSSSEPKFAGFTVKR